LAEVTLAAVGNSLGTPRSRHALIDQIKEDFVNYFGYPELLFLLVGGVIIILPLWKIFSKAGYPGALALGMALPLVNIILLYFLGFSDWPVRKELKALRRPR
jgi:hypothetical protein